MSDEIFGDEHEYDDVAALLRNLPDQAMPDEVWTRLATALSAEAGATPIRPVAPVRRRRWVPAALGAGAAAVAVGIIVPVATLGGANVADAPKQTSAAVSQAITIDTVPAAYVVSSGTDYSEPAMTSQVMGLLGQVGIDTAEEMAPHPMAAPSMVKSGVGDAGQDMTTDMKALHDCLAALAGGPDHAPALVVDRATFAGGPAAIVVFLHGQPAPGKAMMDVIVVNPACTEADRDAARRMTVEVSNVAP